MVMAGFEGGYSLGQKNLELARSKYLVDKLTGKLSEELRKGKAGKLPPLHESARDGLISRGSHGSSRNMIGDDKEDGEETKKDKKEQQQELRQKKKKQKQQLNSKQMHKMMQDAAKKRFPNDPRQHSKFTEIAMRM